MLYYMALIFIVLAVSLDGFGVGITYGIRAIRITIPALFMIMCCSGMIVLLSMSLGHLIRTFITPTFTEKLGGMIFILLGLFVIGSHLKKKLGITFFEHHGFHRFTSILSQPQQVDKDSSGVISGGEAVILGIALAIDALGAGFASAMIGYPPLLMAILIALMSGLFLYSGIKIGLLLSRHKTFEKLTLLPPLLLITIGIYNLL